jgi:predicted Zn-dependent protease with MMP-like domain
VPGAPDNVVVDTLDLYPDQDLIDKMTTDLSGIFQYGWLEERFSEFLSETMERLVIDHHKVLKEIADGLAVEVTIYLTDNKLI